MVRVVFLWRALANFKARIIDLVSFACSIRGIPLFIVPRFSASHPFAFPDTASSSRCR